nr:component of a tRNA splicing complex, sen1 [Cryptomonas sp.]
MQENKNIRLMTEILSWKISIFKENKMLYRCQKIPRIFESIEEYKKNFEPLFLEEIYAQFVHLLKVDNDVKMVKNGFIYRIELDKDKISMFISFATEEIYQYQIGSLVVIYFNPDKYKNNSEKIFIFGIVSDVFVEHKYLRIEVDISNQFFFSEEKKDISIFLFNQISATLPYVKGYDVIHSLEKIPSKIRNILLYGISKKEFFQPVTNYDLSKSHLKKHFNKSQTDAIFAVFEKEITLIQGPPGTGKTRTIVGIISLLAKESITDSLELNDVFRNKVKEKILYLHSKRIIICATSNAAVDENATRSSAGFPYQKITKALEPYSIFRMGPNYHFSLDHISLDNLALSWASENDKNIKFWINKAIIQKARINIIKKGALIYTTLACTGYSIFEKVKSSETIIIDEAAQAIEIDTLIPLRNTCKKLVLIGDVQQLPATIFCKTSIIFEYDRSLFKRLQLQKYPVWFLKTQYRMHPQISSFPARKFYKNGLRDSENVAHVKKYALRCFGPLNFFDIREGIEKNHLKQNTSWCNLDEMRIVTLIFRSLICLNSNLNVHSIGIITGYNGQIKELQNYEINKKIDLKQQINTVDGFQGKEKDFIFFSCVRSKFERGIGFLSDCRRINVAFTRARIAFWIIGNLFTLYKDENWKEIILDSQRRSRFFCLKKPLERSSRRLIYWSIDDQENYSFDGENSLSISIKLLIYVKKVIIQKKYHI